MLLTISNKLKALKNLIKKILYPLRKKDIKNLSFIFILTVIAAIFELLGIGLIIPILNIFVGNDFQKYIDPFEFLVNLDNKQILNLLLFFLVLIYFVKFFILRNLIYLQNDFSYKLFTDISKKIFQKYLFKDFSFHLNKNSSELIRNIQSEANLFSFGVVFPIIRLLSEILIFISICVILIIYEWQASLITIFLMSFVGFVILRLTNERLKKWGRQRSFHSALALKQLQQSFSSIREIILNKLEHIFLNKYHYHNLENAFAGKQRDTITQLPRLIMELIGVSVFLLLIIFLTNIGREISEIFVITGVFFFASTRLLPSISKIAQSIQSIKFNSVVVDLIYNELAASDESKNEEDVDQVKDNNLIFDEIKFEKVDFSYLPKDNKILSDINIRIEKSDKIGIIGKTGSGKSTFINLFCGLLNPQKGKIILNNKDLNYQKFSWQNMIGYVPQNVSIVDESILFNICLEDDKEKINLKKVEEILKILDLYDYIYRLPKKLDELAGEGGKNLSGGQCQRIGIARALYKNPTILLLDEATSSLDESTESKILNNIFEIMKDKIIIFSTHRKNMSNYCNKTYEIYDS